MKKILPTAAFLALAVIATACYQTKEPSYSTLAQSHQMAPRTQMHFDFVSHRVDALGSNPIHTEINSSYQLAGYQP